MNRMTLDDIKKVQKDKGKELPKPKEGEVMMHWFANGYKINDGEFHDISDPETQKFLKEMETGKVPKSLQREYPEAEKFVLDDRKKEMYKLPPPPKEKFPGQAVSLSGDIVPPSKNQFDALQNDFEQLAVNLKAGQIKIDKSKETGNIQFILHNGDKVSVEVNETTKVSELFDYINAVAPVNGKYQLLAGFPPKPLTNLNSNIEDNDLMDSRISQKIV